MCLGYIQMKIGAEEFYLARIVLVWGDGPSILIIVVQPYRCWKKCDNSVFGLFELSFGNKTARTTCVTTVRVWWCQLDYEF